MKKTAKAYSNIAFVKYWGRKNETLRLPTNGSISMNLSDLFTITTVEFSPQLKQDSILINDKVDDNENNRVVEHLNRIRALANTNQKARVVSKNNFPVGTGLSSSASGFAALTIAASAALGLGLSEKELSILARQGSGSACRSIPGGFVEWKDGDTNEESYAHSLHPAGHWDIVDIIAVTSKQRKQVTSTQGQLRAQTSIFFSTRIDNIKKKLEDCRSLIEKKNFAEFGKLIEMEALEMHAVMLTSWPPLIYWLPQSIEVMKAVQGWRQQGIQAYFTINTGQDIHIVCQKEDEAKVTEKIKELSCVINVIPNSPAGKSHLTETHLF